MGVRVCDMIRVLMLSTLLLGVTATAGTHPLVIAHRGASGYLPEHTLEAAAYAHALGADFIEQDLVMSRDGELVVLHDIHLETTTDVARKFPERARADGRFYAIDFDWAELQTLEVNERVNAATGKRVFPDRFPLVPGPFRLCRMEDQLQLIHGLNQSTGRIAGIYPEIKQPAWHASEGKDPGAALLALLDRYGYRDATDPVFVQCFDPAELKRLRFERQTRLRLIQLIGKPEWNESTADYGSMRTPEGLAEVATYAQGIGPHLDMVVVGPNQPPTPLTRDARALRLLVHPYTVRADALPEGFETRVDLIRALHAAGVNGWFTDHPDVTKPDSDLSP